MHAGADGPRAAAPFKVLFVCTANAIRSPMAAGLMARRFGPLARIESAGIRVAEAVDPLAAAAMDEIGVDLTTHRPRTLAARLEEGERFDAIVTLSPEAHHLALEHAPELGATAEYWPTFDPSISEGTRAQRLDEYRLVRDRLDQRIAERFPRPSTG